MIAPYVPATLARHRNAPRLVGWVTDPEYAVDEEGALIPLAEAGHLVLYADAREAGAWMLDGHGEVIYWNGEAIRWKSTDGARTSTKDAGARSAAELAPTTSGTATERSRRSARKPTNVSDGTGSVILLRDHPPDWIDTLEGLYVWADWLRYFGAAPGSPGSASFSLLRATLTESIGTMMGDVPPISCLVGGRVEMTCAKGSYAGPVLHHDMQASYPRMLAGTRYGGYWHVHDGKADPDDLVRAGVLVFAAARVELGAGGRSLGPLVRRPDDPTARRRERWRRALKASKDGTGTDEPPEDYPTEGVIEGVWTWQELSVARGLGCDVGVSRVWVHAASEEPFRQWWAAVEGGRELGTFAGPLAKVTGSALYGRFALGDGFKFSRRRRGSRLTTTNLDVPRTFTSDLHLAESVTGRVRAELTLAMAAAGPALLSAHTDGLWMTGESDEASGVGAGVEPGLPGHLLDVRLAGADPNDGVERRDGQVRPSWRLKDVADAFDILGPQTIAYVRPGSDRVIYKVAGAPEGHGRYDPCICPPCSFETSWRASRLTDAPLAHRWPLELPLGGVRIRESNVHVLGEPIYA